MNAPYDGDRGQGAGGPAAGDPYPGPPEPGRPGASGPDGADPSGHPDGSGHPDDSGRPGVSAPGYPDAPGPGRPGAGRPGTPGPGHRDGGEPGYAGAQAGPHVPGPHGPAHPGAGRPTAGGPGHPGLSDPRMAEQQAADMYVQDAYAQDPYRAQDPTAQDPVAEALHDRAARPPVHPDGRPVRGQGQAHGQGPYAPPAAGGQDQHPHRWSPGPGAGPDGARPGPYGDDAASRSVGVDGPASGGSGDDPQQDAFAHLFRDQQYDAGRRTDDAPRQQHDAERQFDAGRPGEPGPGAVMDTGTLQLSGPGLGGVDAAGPTAPPAPAQKSGARSGNILKSSAIMAAGTMVSRLTGFVRTIVITAALGSGLLGDAFTVAYTLPTMVYILTVGGGLNSVFVPQLVRSMKEDEDGGEAYANRLLTLVMVALGVITVIVVAGAPYLIRLQSPVIADDVAANSVAVTFARYCLPTIFFMGIHVVMGQILNARGKFGAMMWTPVLNNIVMIATFGSFIWVYGTSAHTEMGVQTISPEGIRLLGVGTLLGLVVQALAMMPYLREAGFRFRPRFDWRGHGLGKTVALAKWTVLFVLANQAGLIVVTELSTAAGKASHVNGTGFLAYTNAQLIWAMPQAIITVSVMAALLPRISRAAADNDFGAIRDDISQGLRNSAVVIVPISFAFVALGVPMCTLLYSSTGAGPATSMGYILMAFGVGLIPYSVQYVVLRGFYAFEDTRTPFYNTVIVAISNAAVSGLCYVLLPARWAVVGMAGAYGLAYAVGVGVAWRRLRKRLGGDLDGKQVLRSYARLCMASIPAALVGGALGLLITRALGHGVLGSIAALIGGGLALLAVFVLAARRMRVQELNSVIGMVRGRLGR